MKLAAIMLLLWLLPLSFFYFLVGDFYLWRVLILFFTKTAFVTIGGSYRVIPYVAQVAVSKLHWLTGPQMTDGLALAETTPGPLIIVVLSSASWPRTTTSMAHCGWEPWVYWQRLSIRFCLASFCLCGCAAGGANPGQVGAIGDLTLFLGKAAIFPSGVVGLKQLNAISLAGVMPSLLLLQRFKLKIIPVTLLSIGFGSMRYILG